MTEYGVAVEAAVKQAKRKRGSEKFGASKRNAARNWQDIFATIVRVDGPSAQDIIKITGLGPSTVTHILRKMREKKLVISEDGERTGRGRRPRPVRVNDRAHYIAGVEIRPNGLTGLVVDLRGQPVGKPRSVSFTPGDPERPVDIDMVVDRVRDLIDDLTDDLSAARTDQASLLGLGVEVGGHVDGHSGTVVFSTNLRWGDPWHTGSVPLRQLLRAATRLHTVVDNDANALGIAQRYFGAARGDDNFVVVLVTRDGVGSAEFRNGELHRGVMGNAGEIGHIPIAPGGPKCRCGKEGCVEAVATESAICRSLGVKTFSDALALVEKNDPAAKRAFADAGAALGRALSTALILNDPGKIILTGDAIVDTLAPSGARQPVLFHEDYHQAMSQALQAYAGFSSPDLDGLRLIQDKEGWNGARGAATMVIRDIIDGAVEV